MLLTQRVEPRARFELAFPEYRSGASPTMLTGLEILEPMERIERSSVAYHATALSLSYIGWSQRGYSKPRPPRYECGALPLELLRHGAGAENRTPLIGLAIRCPANRPHPQKVLERTEIIEISSLGWRPRAQPIYHARSYITSVMLFSCQRPASRYTSTESLLGQSELGQNASKLPIKQKKRAALFGGRPLLETGIVIPRRSGHLARIMIHAPLRAFDFGSELEYLCHAVQS